MDSWKGLFGYLNYGYESAEWENIFLKFNACTSIYQHIVYFCLDFMVLLLRCLSYSLLNWTMLYRCTEFINGLDK